MTKMSQAVQDWPILKQHGPQHMALEQAQYLAGFQQRIAEASRYRCSFRRVNPYHPAAFSAVE